MPKIAFIGAGSAVFTRALVGDILSRPALAESATLALMDVDAGRLRTAETIARRLADGVGAAATVEATLDRRAALAGADYVVTSFQVGGYRPATVVDFEVPKRFGLRQTIGDTLGVGGIMRGLRTIPVLLDVCRDMEEVCPDALLLNYVNPMAMLCWAVAEASPIRTLGLCHSVQHTAAELAADLGVPAAELDHHVAGINHLAFFLRLERDGEDLYPALRRIVDEDRVPAHNRVRYELHAPLRLLRHRVLRAPRGVRPVVHQARAPGAGGALQHPPRRVPAALRGRHRRVGHAPATSSRATGRSTSRRASSTAPTSSTRARPASRSRFNANVPNTAGGARLIDNLPGDCCVEVPCVASASGVEPQPVGPLPRHLAALIETNVNVQGLTVEAALTGRRDAVHHAAMLDPHTAAELPLDEIARLVEALLEAHGDWIPPLA